MKKIEILILASALSIVVFCGCVVQNPAGVYSPSAALTNDAAIAQQIAPIVSGILAGTPAAPVAPFVPTGTELVLGIITAVSGAYAAYKNKQATTHANAAAALAATVVNSGQVAITDAMAHAAGNNSTAAVAQHIANAQSPT